MSDTEVTAAVSVETIVAKVAELRVQIPPLRDIIANAHADLSHWLDEIDTELALDEIARTEKKIGDIHAQVVELARLVAEPHPLWPGGWLIEEIVQDNQPRRWRAPWAPWDAAPGTPGARRRAWRTRAAAEAAIPTDRPERYRVMWSPLGTHDYGESLDVPLDAASLDAVGNPRVRVHDAFAGYSRWSSTGRSEVVHVIALPSAEVLQLAGQYAPIFDDQPALAAVAQPWLHLNLWAAPGDHFNPVPSDLEEQITARVLADRPEIGADAVNRVLATFRAEPKHEPWQDGGSWWRYYREMEELLRGSPLPALPASDNWEGRRNVGPEVPMPQNWPAVPLVAALRENLLAQARQQVLDSFAAHLAEQPAVEVTVGTAVADEDGVQLDLSPDAPLQALIERCDAWPRLRGYSERRWAGWRPTLPIAYGTDDAQVDLTGLYNIRERITWTITDVAVVAMRRDPKHAEYSWEEIDRIPLRRN